MVVKVEEIGEELVTIDEECGYQPTQYMEPHPLMMFMEPPCWTNNLHRPITSRIDLRFQVWILELLEACKLNNLYPFPSQSISYDSYKKNLPCRNGGRHTKDASPPTPNKESFGMRCGIRLTAWDKIFYGQKGILLRWYEHYRGKKNCGTFQLWSVQGV